MDQAIPQSAAPTDPAAAPAPGGELPAPNPEIMSPLVLAHMDELEAMRELLDGQLGDAYDRVLTAGMKMMYSAESAELLHKFVTDDQVPIANKLGEGVANLVVMMDNQGNGSIPKEVLAPVGVALMMEAADYLFELGIEVTEKDLSDGLEMMVRGLFVGYGVEADFIDKVTDDMAEKMGFDESAMAAAPEAAAPAEAPGEEAGFAEGFAADQAAREV